MHRFDFEFFGGLFGLLFRLGFTFDLSGGIGPVYSTGIGPVHCQTGGIGPIA